MVVPLLFSKVFSSNHKKILVICTGKRKCDHNCQKCEGAPRSRSTALTFASFIPTCALSLTRRRSGVCAENAGASSFTSDTFTAHRHR